MAKKKDKETQKSWSHKNDFPLIEVWNTYQAIAELIVPRLRTIKEHGKHGFCPDFKGMKEWNGAIQKMIDAFELLINSSLKNRYMAKRLCRAAKEFIENGIIVNLLKWAWS